MTCTVPGRQEVLYEQQMPLVTEDSVSSGQWHQHVFLKLLLFTVKGEQVLTQL